MMAKKGGTAADATSEEVNRTAALLGGLKFRGFRSSILPDQDTW